MMASIGHYEKDSEMHIKKELEVVSLDKPIKV